MSNKKITFESTLRSVHFEAHAPYYTGDFDKTVSMLRDYFESLSALLYIEIGLHDRDYVADEDGNLKEVQPHIHVQVQFKAPVKVRTIMKKILSCGLCRDFEQAKTEAEKEKALAILVPPVSEALRFYVLHGHKKDRNDVVLEGKCPYFFDYAQGNDGEAWRKTHFYSPFAWSEYVEQRRKYFEGNPRSTEKLAQRSIDYALDLAPYYQYIYSRLPEVEAGLSPCQLEQEYYEWEKSERDPFDPVRQGKSLKMGVEVYEDKKIRQALLRASENYFAGRKESQQVQVLYFYGDTGTGKTTYAREYCRAKGYPFYQTSAGKNLMDEYKGEPVVLVDELRGSTMKCADLLKLTDPWSHVSASARYTNKDTRYIKLLIITSNLLPCELYSNEVWTKEQSYRAFMRRITQLWVFGKAKVEELEDGTHIHVTNTRYPVSGLESCYDIDNGKSFVYRSDFSYNKEIIMRDQITGETNEFDF